MRKLVNEKCEKFPIHLGNSAKFLPMQNEAAITAGQSIRAVRELAGLTQAEAAQLTGRSVAYLSQVENGKARSVTTKYVANTIGALSAYIANPIAKTRTPDEVKLTA